MTRRSLSHPRSQRNPAALMERWRTDLDEQHIIALRWSPDGQTLAVAAADGPIGMFERADGGLRHTLAGHRVGTLALDWRPDGALLASAGQDGQIRLWDACDGSQRAALAGGASWVERIAWSPATSRPATVPRGSRAAAPVPAASAEPAILASAAGKTLCLWDAEGQLLRTWNDHPSTIADIGWMPVSGRVRPLDRATETAPEASSAILAVAAYGGLTLRRPDRDEPLGRYTWKGSTLVIAWSPDGNYIATGDQDATVHFWITRNGQDLQMWGYPTKVRELAWDTSSRYLATGGGAAITVWDCGGKGPEGTRPLQLEAHAGQISALAFQRRGSLLASCCSDGLVAVWQIGAGQRPLATTQFESGIAQLAWSPDDQLLAVGSETGDVAVFAAPT